MPEKPNLDLINLVQQGRMAHDQEARPSQVSGVYWIEAKAPVGSQPGPTTRAGSWIMTTSVDEVDKLWAKIKAATEAGNLSYKSKVSTASRDGSSASRVIQVLVADSADQAEVDRVRASLDALGIEGEWTYHAD